MKCPYAIYEDVVCRPRILCTAKNGMGVCINSKLCLKVEKFIPTEKMGDCYIMKTEQRQAIPTGSNYVRAIKNGKVYVEFENRVIVVDEFSNDITNYVYLKEVEKGKYEASLFPFVEEDKPKKKTRKKTETTEEEVLDNSEAINSEE